MAPTAHDRGEILSPEGLQYSEGSVQDSFFWEEWRIAAPYIKEAEKIAGRRFEGTAMQVGAIAIEHSQPDSAQTSEQPAQEVVHA